MKMMKLPNVLPRLEKNNSLYYGPFSKGEFISPLATFKVPLTLSTKSEVKSKGNITPNDSLRALRKPKDSETDSVKYPLTHRQGSLTPGGQPLLRLKDDITSNNGLTPISHIRTRSTPKLPLQPSRQGSLTDRGTLMKSKRQNESQNYTKGLDDLPNNRNQEAINSNVKTYLRYLDHNNQDNADLFASRLRRQSGIEKVHDADPHNESSEVDKYWLEKIFDKEHKLSVLTKNNPRSQARIDTCSTPTILGHRNSKKSTVKEPSKTDLDPSPGRRNGLKIRKSTRVLTVEEIMAKELADEINLNYEIYTDHAVKIPDLKHRIDEYFSAQGVMPIFIGKGDEELSLITRIMNDMLEAIEMPTPISENLNTLVYHTKKVRTKLKLIQEKYVCYGKVNKELEEVNLEFKVRQVQYVEADLRKAHGEFILRKHEILTKIAKTSLNRYIHLKGQCEGVENAISNFNSFPLHDDNRRDPLGEPTLNMRINKKLEDLLASWKKDLRGIKEF